MAHIKQSRNVIVAFTQESKIRDRRLTIARHGHVLDLIRGALTADEMLDVIGVKDSTGNNWIA